MSAELVFRCKECGREFQSLEERRAHDARPHDAASPSGFMCGACGAPFDSPKELAQHARRRHSE
ncbi:MAG TPA: C2H2-type zinc finger protein [Thermoplasmata archaeon]|nr:C2H2-type zinc finger protein [Thermoplasmata archaeon]